MKKMKQKENNCSLSNAEIASLKRDEAREEALLYAQYESRVRRALGANNAERAFRRAKKRVFELIGSNADLNMFVTFTLAFSRDDYNAIIKRLGQWMDNRVRRNGLRYIIVPEYHDDEQSIHFHGVFNENALRIENSGLKRGRKTVYNVPEWEFGFSSAVRINAKKENWVATANRITDYILKSAGKVGGRYYLHGGKLAEPVREYFSSDYVFSSGDEFTIDGKFHYKIAHFL